MPRIAYLHKIKTADLLIFSLDFSLVHYLSSVNRVSEDMTHVPLPLPCYSKDLCVFDD